MLQEFSNIFYLRYIKIWNADILFKKNKFCATLPYRDDNDLEVEGKFNLALIMSRQF